MAKKAVEFSLFAPYNEDVSLIGSWNNWKPAPMTRGEDGIWRVEVPLSDGSYEYKFELVSKSYFMMGEKVAIADPVALRYTQDSHENAIVRVKNGQRVTVEYEWQHDDVPLPPNHELVIYEMHLGDFCGGGGSFTKVIEKLDYLADLGINAIELMPVNEFPGHHSWGYSQRSIYAVENSYGSPEDLCRFVDECHARGIRVIHDAVYNHMEMEAPLTRVDFNYWFYGDEVDPPELRFGPKFNFEFHDDKLNVWPARQHVMNAMRQWAHLFHIDGIRFDATRAIRYYDLLNWFHDQIHNQIDFKPFYMIAEHIPQDPTIAGPEGPMDAAWHDNFYRQMSATTLGVDRHGRYPYNTSEVLRLLHGRGDGFAAAVNTVHYLATHDEDHVMYLLGAAANTFDEAAFRRVKMGASILFTAPGVPMIWMGDEFGQPTPRSIEPQPLQWELLENEQNQGLFNHFKHLIHLRKTNPALTSENYEVVADMAASGIIAFKRWNDAGNVVLVVANLRDSYAGEFTIGDAGLEDGTWHEAVFNYDTHIENGTLRDTLAESEVKVYIKQ